MHSLSEYRHHADRFGPELILETARRYLPEDELSELAAHIKVLTASRSSGQRRIRQRCVLPR